MHRRRGRLIAYVAVFTFFGVWLSRSTVWGLAYILIWEGLHRPGRPWGGPVRDPQVHPLDPP